MLTCSSLGPFGGQVLRAGNTQFEFVLRRLSHLDKITFPQHAGRSLASLKSLDSGSTGLDWGWI
jgi:hypothetical protein